MKLNKMLSVLLSSVLSICLAAPSFGAAVKQTKEKEEATKVGYGVISAYPITGLPSGIETVIAATREMTLPDGGNPVYTASAYTEIFTDPANTLILLRLYSVIDGSKTQIGGPLYVRVTPGSSSAYTLVHFAVDPNELSQCVGFSSGCVPAANAGMQVSWELTATLEGGSSNAGYANIAQLAAVRIQ
jgi:hypothetical protein